jgi:hypothetical protein
MGLTDIAASIDPDPFVKERFHLISAVARRYTPMALGLFKELCTCSHYWYSMWLSTKRATMTFGLASATLRLRFGQRHKSLFCRYKPFIHKHLQRPMSD